MDRVRLNTVIELVSRVLNPAGYDCIEADWVGDERILRLFVDRTGSDGKTGIMVDDCVKASKLLDEYQELDNAVSGAYTLEVSSPGVERPLRLKPDFERHVGATVEVKLVDKVQERRHGSGKLLPLSHDAEGTIITLETTRGPWSFPLTSLQRAHLVYDWGANG